MRVINSSRIMPRTTIDLDRDVLEGLRKLSRRQSKSMGQLASELLAPAISQADAPAERHVFRLRTARLGRPHIDLEDKEAMRAALEGSQR
jgi:hypothetical protein